MKTKNTTPKPKSAPLFVQFGIYTAILFVANGISSFFPASLPVPAPVIGLILLYLLLSCHIVKLEWVDSFGSFLISIIGFLFVPSGISLAASLNIMATQGLQLVVIITLSTIILLVVIAYTTRFVIWCRQQLPLLWKKRSRVVTGLHLRLNHQVKGSQQNVSHL